MTLKYPPHDIKASQLENSGVALLYIIIVKISICVLRQVKTVSVTEQELLCQTLSCNYYLMGILPLLQITSSRGTFLKCQTSYKVMLTMGTFKLAELCINLNKAE